MIKNLTILILISFAVSCSSSKTIKNNKEERQLKTGTVMEMNSEEYLTQNNTWNLQSTEYIKFYFDKELSESFKNEVIKAQQENYLHITDLMEIDKESFPNITFFLFKDKAQKKLLTKLDSDAHAINPNVYYLPKNAKGGQEIGHVITQTIWGFIPNDSEFALLIDEGFNFYLDDNKFYKGKLDEYALEYINSHQEFDITDLTKNGKGLRNNGGHSLNESYVAGSFAKYLIKEYGIEKFGKLWNLAVVEANPRFEKIYDKELSQIGIEYIMSLK